MAPHSWHAADDPPDLPPGSVHVWRAATLSSHETRDAELLSPGEKSRAERLRRPEERRRWVAARATVRRVLARYAGAPPEELSFDYGPFGKPYLPEGDGARFRFSVSHAGDLLLVAVTHGSDVGVDVERVREVRRWQRVAERHFAREVRDVLEGMEPARAPLGFLHAWTCLEAHAKARGGGVYATRTHLPLPWPPPLEGVVVREQGPDAGPGPWTLRALHPADGFVAMLAVEGAVTGYAFLEAPTT